MLQGRKIVIVISGSIAAYKIPFLVRLLVRESAEVRVVMTPAATDFVTPLTLSTLSKNPVIVEPFDRATGAWNNHVELGQWADAMIFAPMTANMLGKMAHGIADNFATTVYLSAKCPVFIAPAMDLDMYLHPTTKANIATLSGFGNIIIEPQVGELASGLSGPGRMEEPERILEILSEHLLKGSALQKKKVLVTAGPTFEKIDPVRFIGNFSTGRMGFALAEEAAARGAEVVLVTGPTAQVTNNSGISRVDVSTASEMMEACIHYAQASDIVIMAAAVADYTPDCPSARKLKKKEENLAITLKKTPDILALLGREKPVGQVLVGFALETDNEEKNAVKKLREKNLDCIVLNSLNDPGAGFGTATNKVTIIGRDGIALRGRLEDKGAVAAGILDYVVNNLVNKP